MVVSEIVIGLTGRYDLSKLEDIGYKRGESQDIWCFDGRQHRYTFIRVDDLHLEIRVGSIPHRLFRLPVQATFRQLKDWVGRSIEVIELRR